MVLHVMATTAAAAAAATHEGKGAVVNEADCIVTENGEQISVGACKEPHFRLTLYPHVAYLSRADVVALIELLKKAIQPAGDDHHD
jgi:hypothetical protein